VIQCGGGLRFAFETGESLRVAGNFLRQEFKRHEAMKPRVLGFIDDAHSATAEFFGDAIVQNGWHVRHILGCAPTQVNEGEHFLTRSTSSSRRGNL